MSTNKDIVAGGAEQQRRLNFGELWNMNFGFLGIQFGWGLQMANMAAIYTKLGAQPDKIPILTLAGPITGLLVQPIIGAMSDRTWSARFGRRRPYFTVGAIAASIVLFIMPDSPALWVAALSLWLLDASINTSMEPFRAFVADKVPVSQREQGFLMQSFFIGVGATIANALPFVLNRFGVSAQAVNGVPVSVEDSFRVGAFVLLASVLWTVFRTPEKPPADMAAFERRRQATKGLAFGSREIADAIMRMPATMKQLFWVQFFTWFGLSCFWGFFTLAVAHHVFGVTDSKNPLFDRATEWAGMCMAAYSVVCFAVAPILSRLSGALGRPRIHSLALLLGGIGICSILFIHTKQPLMLSMVGFGIAWASILALPYAILSVALPPERVGVYMGIFNFFIVLPQAAASLFLQPIVKYVFHEDPVRVVMMGGVCFFIAALLALRVVEHVAEPTVSTGPAIAEGRVEEVVGAPS